MPNLDDLFEIQKGTLIHPRLRSWQDRLAAPDAFAQVEVSRPLSALGQLPAEMHVQFRENGKLLPLESLPWDDDLNAGLIGLGVRASSPEQEAERFGLGLQAALRPTEQKFGDGYFNAVLLDLVKDSDLTQHAPIADVLQHTYGGCASREGRALDRYTLCREKIADAISGRAQELTGPLGYSREEAKRILVLALARYLDDRFSVSSRRRLGLL